MYIFHTDPGHGWLAVKRSELIELNILDKVSGCSNQTGGAVYLEEDCDASLFWKAKEAIGEKVDYKSSYQDNTPIRRYERFQI